MAVYIMAGAQAPRARGSARCLLMFFISDAILQRIARHSVGRQGLTRRCASIALFLAAANRNQIQVHRRRTRRFSAVPGRRVAEPGDGMRIGLRTGDA